MCLSTSAQSTPATSVNLASDLINSTAAWVPSMRLKPAIGLSLLNLGATLFMEK